MATKGAQNPPRGTPMSPTSSGDRPNITSLPPTKSATSDPSNAPKQTQPDKVEEIMQAFFTPVLENLINQIVPMADPLDNQKFSSVGYVNTLFPSEQTLVDLDSAISTMKLKMARTDEEILRSVRDQVLSGAKGTRDLQDSQFAVKTLAKKMVDIKTKAEQTEAMVTEISKDIKSLDYAKKNLTATVTNLKRLQMLVNAVTQLTVNAQNKEYKTAANLLQAVTELVDQFIAYKHIEKVGDMVKIVNDIKRDLTKQVYAEFTKYAEDGTANPTASLADACLVIDSLGKEIKRDFMIWYCNQMLSEYNKFFKPGEESGTLEQVERRFNWLKKILLLYDEKYQKVFPPTWKMGELVCEEFCFTTRQHFIDVLEATRKTLDVKVLVAAITKTIALEKELADRFGSVEVIEQDNKKEVEKPPEPEVDRYDMSIEAVKARLAKFHENKRQKEESEKKKKRQVSKFKGIISSCFDLYMNLYISKEDLNMQATLAKALSDETWMIDEDERSKVLASIGVLVEHIRNSMKTCGKLTKNQSFYDLHLVIKKYLKDYVATLSRKIPGSDIRLGERDEKMMCLIINTLEYCIQMMTGIQSSFKKSINEKFVEQVDFKNEQSECENVISKALYALVNSMLLKIEPSLLQMTRMPWATWEAAGDQSDYVNQLTTVAQSSASIFANWLMNHVHFQFILDSFCKQSFIPALVQYVYRCRKIGEVGAQQLMLDFTVIKSSLLELPSSGKNQSVTPSRQYVKIVTKGMDRAQSILKLIGFTPVNGLLESFKTMLGDGTENDLQKICELKGLSKAEAKVLYDAFIQTKATSAVSPPTPNKGGIKNYIPDVSNLTAKLTMRTSSTKQ